MNLILRIDNNIVAIIVSLIFLKNILNCLDKKEVKNKAFIDMLTLTTVELIIETLTCIINGQPYTWLIPISSILHVFLFGLAPFCIYQWYVFAKLWVNNNIDNKWQNNILLLLPAIANLILVVLSPFLKLEFYITQYNVYQRGTLFFMPVAISYFYLFCGFRTIYINKNKVSRIEFIPLFMFGIFTSTASLIQAVFYGLLLMWSSIAYSLIILYLYLQQRMTQIDYLTGAWTREKFHNYLSSRIKQKSKKFSIAFIDLDNFKEINDVFGHSGGDQALIDLVSVIKGVLRNEDSIARYGGDEFVLFLNADSKHEVCKIIKRVHEALADYNRCSGAPYKLSFSCGYEIYDFDRPMTVDEYINCVDKLMYGDKNSKKNIKINL